MSKSVTVPKKDVVLGAKIENVLIRGDLKELSEPERVSYYNKLCTSLGLNPLTKPFEYIVLNGKLQLYARKDCTEQLRKLHQVSIKIADRKRDGELYIVTAEATTRSGRTDSAIGVVAINSFKGADLANACMKAETKAKRRVTLSICGLGFMDEIEVEDISRDVGETNAAKLQAQIEKTTDKPEFEGHQFDEFDPPEEEVSDGPSDYVIKCGKNKGKKIKDLPRKQLETFVSWADSQQKELHADVMEYRNNAVEHLIATEKKPEPAESAEA